MSATNHVKGAKGRLLVVDDDLVQRTVIARIGSKLGYDAVIAPSFGDAVRLLRAERFDAMTLDLSLGEHDGVEVLRLAAEHRLNAMPIVIISGCEERILNSTRRVAESLELSVKSCLPKPLNIDALRDALSLPGKGVAVEVVDRALPGIDRERILLGLQRDEFFVEFQPKVDLDTGKVVGAEALARWKTPDFGRISPAVFIPKVEQFGLMPELTNSIVSSSLRQGRSLIERHPDLAIAVNISGSMLTDLMIPERIDEALRAENVAARHLIVEITESVAMSDVDRAIDILVRLRIKGIGAAIDDFGTGYSSLSALARLPFSELKIDQSFVKGCDQDADMMKIIDASIGLARAFKMKVVAEGIDNPRTLAKVREAGCDVGQGHLFSPSLGLERVGEWMTWRNKESSAGGWAVQTELAV